MHVTPTCIRIDLEPLPLEKAQRKGRALPPVLSTRPSCRIGQKKLKRALTSFFAQVAPHFSRQAVAGLLKAGIKKADSDDLAQVDEVMGGIDFTVFNQLPRSVKPVIQDLYSDAGKEALRTVMVAVNAAKAGGAPDLSPGAWDQVDDGAVEFASLRSAEMVGMRYDKSTGKLTENPDAKWAITEQTRDGIRSLVTQTVKGEISVLDLPDKLKEAYAFSDSRAEMIARTEMRLANGQGALGGLIAAGNVSKKVWITQEDDSVSEECEENADEGPIDIDDDFPSGDQTEPAHPNCRCTVTGHVDWGTDEEE
jgi:SPP1 gp7 family putative phage head morphogenesis protein